MRPQAVIARSNTNATNVVQDEAEQQSLGVNFTHEETDEGQEDRAEQPSSDEPINLLCEGLDTKASVVIGENELGQWSFLELLRLCVRSGH